jgi:hypothetical protein
LKDSLDHALAGQELSVELVLLESDVAVVEVDACSFDALGKFGTLEAVSDAGAEVEVTEEGVVHCCFVVVDCFGLDRHLITKILMKIISN